MPVLTYDQMVESFGNPYAYLDLDGNPTAEWTNRMVAMPLPAPIPYLNTGKYLTTLRVNRAIAPFMSQAFSTLYQAGQWSLLKDCGGAYNWRLARRSNSLSHHSWGIAVDLNVFDNPFMRPPKMDARIVRAFTSAGFVWGGDWRVRKDGMHFEFYDIGRL